MRYKITYQPQSRACLGESEDDLRAVLAGIEQEESVQVWLSASNGESLSAHFNPARAWVMWMSPDGAWACPRNPGVSEHEARLGEPREGCFIENGQLDEYSVASSTPKSEAVRMLLHFFGSGQRPPWAEWAGDF